MKCCFEMCSSETIPFCCRLVSYSHMFLELAYVPVPVCIAKRPAFIQVQCLRADKH
jgi:hypothetical protein